MVIPINTQLPDLAVPPPTKTRVDAIEKVAPIAINDQVSVDPRVAVNLADPVQYSASGNQVKDSLIKTAAQAATQGTGGALSATATANLAAALPPLLQQPSPALGQLIARLQAAGLAPSDQGVTWPEVDSSLPQATPGTTHSPLRAMVQLLQNLGQSQLFSASAMAQAFVASQGHGVDAEDEASLKQRIEGALAHCDPDDPVARDAARLLLNGVLIWHGELVPGVQARMTREDAWREAPDGSGQIQKGATLRVDMQLPNSGVFQVAGVQFGDEVSLSVRLGDDPDAFRSAFPALRERLDTLDVGQIRCRLNEEAL